MNTIISTKCKINGKWEEIEVEFEDTDGCEFFDNIKKFINKEHQYTLNQKELEQVAKFNIKEIIEDNTGKEIEEIKMLSAIQLN
jgi:hypothetical protein